MSLRTLFWNQNSLVWHKCIEIWNPNVSLNIDLDFEILCKLKLTQIEDLKTKLPWNILAEVPHSVVLLCQMDHNYGPNVNIPFPCKNHFIVNVRNRCNALPFLCEFWIMSTGKPLRFSLAWTRIYMIKCLFRTLSSRTLTRRLVFVLLPSLKCFSISSLTSISYQKVKRHWKWLLSQWISKGVLGLILSKHLALFSIFWPGWLSLLRSLFNRYIFIILMVTTFPK